MYATLSSLVLALFLAAPASAIILIATNGDVFAISPGDVFEHVIQLDTSSIVMSGGTVTGHYAMFDSSIATFTGGSVGQLEVLNDAVATMVIQPGTLEIDGAPEITPFIANSGNCAGCTVSAVLANGDPIGPAPLAVLQTGQVEIQAIPEPTTAALFGLGLFGLGLVPGLRRQP